MLRAYDTSGAAWWCAVAVLASIVNPGLASAGRMLASEGADLLAVAGFEIELGAEYARDVSLDGVTAAVGLSIGVADRVGFDATLSALPVGQADAAESIRGDTTLAFEYALADDRDDHLELLLAPSVRLPTGDARRGLGDPGVDVSLGATARMLLGAASLSGDIGYAFETGDGVGDTWTVALAVEYEVGGHWFVDGALSVDLANNPSDVALTVGLTWQPF